METSTVTVFSSPPASPPPPQAPAAADIDAVSLGRLSAHLDRLLDPAFFNCADAELVLAKGGDDGTAVAVHRCILAARSPFFLDSFSSLPAGEKPRLELADLVPGGLHIGRDALLAVLGYLYTGRLKLPPQEAVFCVDGGCEHEACRPAIDFVVESTYAASGFQISELVSLFQRRLSDFLNIASNEDMVPIIRVAFTCQLQDLLDQCIQKVAASLTFNSMYLEKELPGDTYAKIMEIRQTTFPDEPDYVILDPQHQRSIRNIHMALDSHDVHLVGLLLEESAVTLDNAFALHYAAIRCTPKMVSEVLKLESVNVNLKNNSGYTPLHMACIRQEPGIILSLIEKGASVLEWTPDGRDALTICKRLTREKDLKSKLEKGEKRSNAYLCVEILEQTKSTYTSDLVTMEETVLTPLLVDNFHMKLIYLENRVAFARLFFPSQATLAMCTAEADSTEEFIGSTLSKLKEVGLNEIPTMENRRLRERFDALSKTVELGRRYFPNCSKLIDKYLRETDPTVLECDIPEDQQVKKMRFSELKKDVKKALDKDEAAGATVASSTASSSSPTSPRCQGGMGRAKRQQQPAFRKGSRRKKVVSEALVCNNAFVEA